MKILASLIIAVFATTANAAPLCQRVDTGEMVPCYSDVKIDAAMAIIKRRGGVPDRDFVISIEMNRGEFVNARELADSVMH